MQARRSLDPHQWGSGGDREGLIHAYDEENGLGLTDLTESEDEGRKGNGKVYENTNGNTSKKSLHEGSRSNSRRSSPLPR